MDMSHVLAETTLADYEAAFRTTSYTPIWNHTLLSTRMEPL
jgi:hypothetical protein